MVTEIRKKEVGENDVEGKKKKITNKQHIKMPPPPRPICKHEISQEETHNPNTTRSNTLSLIIYKMNQPKTINQVKIMISINFISILKNDFFMQYFHCFLKMCLLWWITDTSCNISRTRVNLTFKLLLSDRKK